MNINEAYKILQKASGLVAEAEVEIIKKWQEDEAGSHTNSSNDLRLEVGDKSRISWVDGGNRFSVLKTTTNTVYSTFVPYHCLKLTQWPSNVKINGTLIESREKYIAVLKALGDYPSDSEIAKAVSVTYDHMGLSLQDVKYGDEKWKFTGTGVNGKVQLSSDSLLISKRYISISEALTLPKWVEPTPKDKHGTTLKVGDTIRAGGGDYFTIDRFVEDCNYAFCTSFKTGVAGRSILLNRATKEEPPVEKVCDSQGVELKVGDTVKVAVREGYIARGNYKVTSIELDGDGDIKLDRITDPLIQRYGPSNLEKILVDSKGFELSVGDYVDYQQGEYPEGHWSKNQEILEINLNTGRVKTLDKDGDRDWMLTRLLTKVDPPKPKEDRYNVKRSNISDSLIIKQGGGVFFAKSYGSIRDQDDDQTIELVRLANLGYESENK